MPKILTDTAVRNAKPRDTRYRLSDCDGLYLEISPNGSKWWRLRYKYHGKERMISLGVYPQVSLKMARGRRDEAKAMLAEGRNPQGEVTPQQNADPEDVITFSKVTDEWFKFKEKTWSETNIKKMRIRRNAYLKLIPEKPFDKLELEDFLPVLKDIEARGKYETCIRVAQMCSQICRYGKILKLIAHNPLEDISQLLVTPKVSHRAAILETDKIGKLLCDIDYYSGFPSVRYALKIMPYVFVRSGELRMAKWDEIDFSKAEWIIPAERMKMRKSHWVPLAKQVVSLFQELKKFSTGDLCFPSTMSKSKCISDVGLLNALRHIGYAREIMCIHGFRAIASTTLNEIGYRPDLIEAQLAHCEKDTIRAAYNRAEYFEERRNMMQHYADYLDSLKLQAG